MQNSDIRQLSVVRNMIYFLLQASKSKDKNLPLKNITIFLESIFEILQMILLKK